MSTNIKIPASSEWESFSTLSTFHMQWRCSGSGGHQYIVGTTTKRKYKSEDDRASIGVIFKNQVWRTWYRQWTYSILVQRKKSKNTELSFLNLITAMRSSLKLETLGVDLVFLHLHARFWVILRYGQSLIRRPLNRTFLNKCQIVYHLY